ncbi:MAG: ribbon-helix-helix protein, CopG family [Dehalococcoidia bacterium]
MRTTITLDDELLREAKRRAAESGRTMTQVIEEAVRTGFAQSPVVKRKRPFRLRTVKGEGFFPGVDINDSAGLRDIMDQVDASS